MKTLLIRADASMTMGTGHVMRTLALAQAWQDAGGRVVYIMVEAPEGILQRLRRENIDVASIVAEPGSSDDARQTIELANRHAAAWVVVDGYQFGGDYQKAIKSAGLKLLVLDDYGHAAHYWADLVLNQNLHTEESLYCSREPYTELLLGTRYALLRREFWKWRGWKRKIADVARKVLVTLGGGDHDNVALKVITALKLTSLPDWEAVVLSGPVNPHYAALEAAIRESPWPIQLRRGTEDMPELMAWADMAIGAAGSTSWERAFMGLPSLLLVLAENQAPLSECMAARGAAMNLGWHQSIDVAIIAQQLKHLTASKTDRAAMNIAGRQLVDGEGAARVVQRMRGEKLRLRDATMADDELLWRWANDPETRARSFSQDFIPWDSHVQWLNEKLQDSTFQLLIAIDENDVPVGQLRLDLHGEGAELSVSIAKERRGSGLGAAVIASAVEKATYRFGATWIDAFVKPDNDASKRAFLASGFRELGHAEVRGCAALQFRRQREPSLHIE